MKNLIAASTRLRLPAAALAALILLGGNAAAQGSSIYQATLAEPGQKTQEVSTAQMRQVLADGSAMVIDTRSHAEYAAGHIPGARVLDGPRAAHVAAVERLTGGDRARALVLYCNGPFCQASRRLADGLVAAGFSNVRRYQLGMPVWRALGGPVELALEGVLRVVKGDRTAVLFDARPAAEFARGSLPGAQNIPPEMAASGKLKGVEMPEDDFNTRIVLFGADAAQAQALARLFAKRPWHNVAYYPGSFATLSAALKTE